MSNTERNVKHARINCRRIKFKSQLTNTSYWVEEMRDFDYRCLVRNRDLAMSSHYYLNNRNDHLVSAYLETDYKTEKPYMKRLDSSMTDSNAKEKGQRREIVDIKKALKEAAETKGDWDKKKK
jgi:hypothetical protein